MGLGCWFYLTVIGFTLVWFVSAGVARVDVLGSWWYGCVFWLLGFEFSCCGLIWNFRFCFLLVVIGRLCRCFVLGIALHL